MNFIKVNKLYGTRKLHLPLKIKQDITSTQNLLGKLPKVLLLGETASPVNNYELPYHDRSMWSILKIVLGLSDNTPLLQVQKATLKAKIAIWDVLSNVHIRGQEIEKPDKPNNFKFFLEKHPTIERICFNGYKAYNTFVRYNIKLNVDLFVLPTSNKSYTLSLDKKSDEWKQILNL